MDGTHVFGINEPSKGKTFAGSLNFTADQKKLLTNAVEKSPEGGSSLETHPGGVATDQPDQYGLPQPPVVESSVEVDDLLEEVLAPSTSASLIDNSSATEDPSLPANTFSKTAETLISCKNQLAANQAQIHLLERQEAMDEFMEHHASGVSTQSSLNRTKICSLVLMRRETRSDSIKSKRFLGFRNHKNRWLPGFRNWKSGLQR